MAWELRYCCLKVTWFRRFFLDRQAGTKQTQNRRTGTAYHDHAEIVSALITLESAVSGTARARRGDAGEAPTRFYSGPSREMRLRYLAGRPDDQDQERMSRKQRALSKLTKESAPARFYSGYSLKRDNGTLRRGFFRKCSSEKKCGFYTVGKRAF